MLTLVRILLNRKLQRLQNGIVVIVRATVFKRLEIQQKLEVTQTRTIPTDTIEDRKVISKKWKLNIEEVTKLQMV